MKLLRTIGSAVCLAFAVLGAVMFAATGQPIFLVTTLLNVFAVLLSDYAEQAEEEKNKKKENKK